DRRMTPAQVVGVLGIRVLAVVDQRRGSASEAEAGDPVVLELRERSAQAGLVIGDVAQGRVSVVYPVAERRATVVDGLGPDARRAEIPFQRLGFLERHVRGQL